MSTSEISADEALAQAQAAEQAGECVFELERAPGGVGYREVSRTDRAHVRSAIHTATRATWQPSDRSWLLTGGVDLDRNPHSVVVMVSIAGDRVLVLERRRLRLLRGGGEAVARRLATPVLALVRGEEPR